MKKELLEQVTDLLIKMTTPPCCFTIMTANVDTSRGAGRWTTTGACCARCAKLQKTQQTKRKRATMNIKLYTSDGGRNDFKHILTWRYNPQRGVLIIQRRPEEDKLSCPQIYKLPIEQVLSITAEPEEH